MLNPGSTIVIHVLLDLALSFPRGWFVDWHLYRFLVVCNNNGPKCRIFSVKLFVVDRPEAVEHQIFFVPRTAKQADLSSDF